MRPPLKVMGAAPDRSACLLTVNHYYRPGFDAWWLALAVSAVFPREIHWVITAALTYPGQKRRVALMPLSRWALGRIARTYGFSAMPPMPPDPRETSARAQAVRRVVETVRREKDIVVGLAPEGRDLPDGKLGWPPPGAGRFMQAISRQGLPFLPVGLFEADGGLCLNFGRLYRLPAMEESSPREADRFISRIVMEHIAALLPEGLQGEFPRREPALLESTV